MAGLHRIARLCVHLLDLRGYVGLSSADEVPHGFTRKSRLRSGEFLDPGRWPAAFHDSRHWCFLKLQPGNEPLRALVEPFLRTWQFDATDPDRAKLQSKWTNDLLEGTVSSRAEELHLRALPEPYVNLSIHTAPDVRPLP